MGTSKSSAGQHQIGEYEQGVELGSVLRQPTVTRLAMLEQVLQHVERMLDLGAHAGLGLFQLFLGAAQRILLHCLVATLLCSSVRVTPCMTSLKNLIPATKRCPHNRTGTGPYTTKSGAEFWAVMFLPRPRSNSKRASPGEAST